MTDKPRTPAVEAFRAEYRGAAGLGHDRQDVIAHDKAPAVQTELAELILAGPQRATASLARRDDGPGDHGVVMDGTDRPRCIWRSTEVTVGPLAGVDEGEGDRTYWLHVHRALFAREAVREGFACTEDIATMFERFALVWPRLT